MNIGLSTNCLYDRSWEEVCRMANNHNIKILEVPITSRDLSANKHFNPSALLKDKKALKRFIDTAEEYEIQISSFGIYNGNPLHPQGKIADEHRADLEALINIAGMLGVKVVNCHAGCPGAGKDALYPNWIGLAYMPEYQRYLKWQWDKKIIPLWRGMVKKARKSKVKFGFEMLPGNCVYNTTTLLRLREEVGEEEIGCCFDPAHLFWQGMDPIECIKRLGNTIINVHAQDIAIKKEMVSINGILETTSSRDPINRAWNQRIAGYGHGVKFWRKFVNTLISVKYVGPLIAEHLDVVMPLEKGIIKVINFLKKVDGVKY